MVATPCGENVAPPTCSSVPASPANYLATLDLTGQVTPVNVGGAPFVPQGGLVYVSPFGR